MRAMRFSNIAPIFLLLSLAVIAEVNGHGLLYEPESRNYVANREGTESRRAGVPVKEYCPHCLNRNPGPGFCGGKDGGSANYDQWLDSTRTPMPWDSRAVYTEGTTISMKSNLWAHHGGHMEVKACAMGRTPTQECMDSHLLTFVEDEYYGMPADPFYPERGYYYGGKGWDGQDFSMKFQLPLGLVGQQVLLQWRYITANSCTPAGYVEYFGRNQELSDDLWSPGIPLCPTPIPLDGDISRGPEQFFSCAEVTILPSDGSPQITATPVASPTYAPVSNPASDDTTLPPQSERPMLIAYMGNWHACPTPDQYKHYTHVVVAFAVSYVWNANGNVCSAACDIRPPPVCNGNGNMLDDLRASGIKVILSFGGAGMGGSWESSVDDCWEDCFGKEDHVINQVTNIVQTMNLDGVDIDYEYFFYDEQNGSNFTKGAEAQYFLKRITQGLRTSLGSEAIVTHAPMDIDLVPESPYFQLLEEVKDDLSFLMPQYYNGISRPVSTGLMGSFGSNPSPWNQMNDVANAIFGGDKRKVIFGFCISDCSGTGSNTNANQAVDIVRELNTELEGIVSGGAFFWVTNDDIGGAWSEKVQSALYEPLGGIPAPTPTPAPVAPNDPPTVQSPTEATERPTNPLCRPCIYGSVGDCQNQDRACFDYMDAEKGLCWPGSFYCGVVTYSPTSAPTDAPSATPSAPPTKSPSSSPSGTPTDRPSSVPTGSPSTAPSAAPTKSPSSSPSGTPTDKPSSVPTGSPSSAPSAAPTERPSSAPSASPTDRPSAAPTDMPSSSPSATPTERPTSAPTNSPSSTPSTSPTSRSSQPPTAVPTAPTSAPTDAPSHSPTSAPVQLPSDAPSSSPTDQPTIPTTAPTVPINPACRPCVYGSVGVCQIANGACSMFMDPANQRCWPGAYYCGVMTHAPTDVPTHVPTKVPTRAPTLAPTRPPTVNPTKSPSTSVPTVEATAIPTGQPVTSNPTQSITPSPTTSSTTTPETQPPEEPNCPPCFPGTVGDCQQSNTVCWPYTDPATRTCFPGTIDCAAP